MRCKMSRFIELTYVTDKSRVLVNIDNIIAIEECGECCFVITDKTKKYSLGHSVVESFENIRQQIIDVQKAN